MADYFFEAETRIKVRDAIRAGQASITLPLPTRTQIRWLASKGLTVRPLEYAPVVAVEGWAYPTNVQMALLPEYNKDNPPFRAFLDAWWQTEQGQALADQIATYQYAADHAAGLWVLRAGLYDGSKSAVVWDLRQKGHKVEVDSTNGELVISFQG